MADVNSCVLVLTIEPLSQNELNKYGVQQRDIIYVTKDILQVPGADSHRFKSVFIRFRSRKDLEDYKAFIFKNHRENIKSMHYCEDKSEGGFFTGAVPVKIINIEEFSHVKSPAQSKPEEIVSNTPTHFKGLGLVVIPKFIEQGFIKKPEVFPIFVKIKTFVKNLDKTKVTINKTLIYEFKTKAGDDMCLCEFDYAGLKLLPCSKDIFFDPSVKITGLNQIRLTYEKNGVKYLYPVFSFKRTQDLEFATVVSKEIINLFKTHSVMKAFTHVKYSSKVYKAVYMETSKNETFIVVFRGLKKRVVYKVDRYQEVYYVKDLKRVIKRKTKED